MFDKKFYAVIDCETSTIPKLKEVQGDNAGLNFPLIYDLAVRIQDRRGIVYWQKNWIISEIYASEFFNTGFYANKRPKYQELIKQGKAIVTTWDSAKLELLIAMEKFNTIACAYNAFFDFKKAFHSTNRLVRALYSNNNTYAVSALTNELLQKKSTRTTPKQKKDTPEKFWLVDRWFDIIDIWDFACSSIFQRPTYKNMALDNGWYSPAGNYKTNAECAYRYITQNTDFIESHTAMDDVVIEGEILAYLFKDKTVKIPYGITGFPWRKVGKINK